MEIKYRDLKKTLNDIVKERCKLKPNVPVYRHVEFVVNGQLKIQNLLSDFGDYCSYEDKVDVINYYKASLLLDPKQNELWGKMALNYHLNSQNKKALKLIDKALVIYKEDVDHLELKQSILIDLRRFQEALFLFEQIDKLNPASSIAYFNRGKAFIELGFYDKAITSLLKAMELDPEENEIPFYLAKIYRYHLLDEALADKYEAMAGLI
jgi:tetratricopeptide (TPR) repeat protein